MKKILYILLLLPVISLAQTTSQNYVRSYIYKNETMTSDASKAHASVTYFDGLGRPVQQIAGQMSGTGKDMVTHIQYDDFGRQTREYLPYEAPTADLSFNASAESSVLSFYGAIAFQGTLNPYSEKFLEASPLNRLIKQAAPGNLWQGHTQDDNDRTVKYAYLSNTSDTPVRKLRAIAANPINNVYNISLIDDGIYGVGQLYRTITQGENTAGPVQTGRGFKSGTEEYKDKDGRIVLKKSYVSTEDNFNMPGLVFPLTYYVYDQYGNLTYVIPGSLNVDISQASIDRYGYQYKYDFRNRLVEKKLPGKDWEYIVYDNLDRVVATGPAYSPFGSVGNTEKGWIITKYDIFGRVAYSGWLAAASFSSGARNTIQGFTFTPEAKTTSATLVDNISIYYTNNSYPQSGLKLLEVNYYDNYNFPLVAAFPTAGVEGQGAIANAKGQPTGKVKRILTEASETFLEVLTLYYDPKGRPIRSRINNTQLGGYTIEDSKLDFDGSLLYRITKHKRTNSASEAEISIRNDFAYTAQDRLFTETHTIGTGVSEVVRYNNYNSIGQLTQKLVGQFPLSPLQVVDYTYNIRGWMTGINNMNNLASTGKPQDLFAFRINYTDASQHTTVSPNFNGNITETSWKTSTDNLERRYSYSYDELNRLRESYYQIPRAVIPLRNSYNESMKYDSYGNILSLKRAGGVDDENTPVMIDNLTYTYTGHRLDKIVDNSNSPQGFHDLTANNVNDFGYDGFGNLISDLNKGIAVNGIIYNHLNLPVKITLNSVSGIGTISYIYNASGTKLKKTILNTGVTPNVITNTDYLKGFQYTNNVMDFFPTSEGYVKNTVVNGTNTYNYVYNYTDHLGNVRMSYTLDPADGVLKIMEENHYYPFGLKHSGYNGTQKLLFGRTEIPKVVLTPVTSPSDVTYNIKYNGKELQDELGLNMYDYGARNYDPAIGRWFNVDPLAEQMRRHSPYNYCFNNPMRFTDPDGMGPEDWIKWKSSSGSVHVTYDSSITSTQQAADKGYTNVQQVFSEAPGSTSDGENFYFNSDGTYSVNGNMFDVDNISYTTIGGATISENKGIGDAFGDFGPGALDAGGNALGAAAVVSAETGIGAPAAPVLGSLAGAFKTLALGASILNEAVEKSGKGKGTVSKDQRDPKRLFTRKQTSQKLDEQDGKCANCGDNKNLNEVDGHHNTRHADGGRTTMENLSAVCKDCHPKLHQ